DVGCCADGDEAVVARLPDLPEPGSVRCGRVGPGPDHGPGASELLDQAALEAAQLGTVATRAAADRTAGERVATVTGLLQRDLVGVVAGRAVQATDLLLPLRRTDGARLHQPARSVARERQRGPASVPSRLHVLGRQSVLGTVEPARVVLHVRACRRKTAAAHGRLLGSRARRC